MPLSTSRSSKSIVNLTIGNSHFICGMLKDALADKKIILGSGSPRRHQLLKGLDLDFDIIVKETDESWPEHLIGGQIPEYIARAKSEVFGELDQQTILITADTTVWLNDGTLNKPKDTEDARTMLRSLAGKTHQVFTGVAIRSAQQCISFYDETSVSIKQLSEAEIDYHVSNYNHLDKAGAYGAQDWIGYIAIEGLKGCYYNVMGFPLRRVYESLLTFK